MRIQKNVTGVTVRLTPEDHAGLMRELEYLSDDNALIKRGKLATLLDTLKDVQDTLPHARGTIDRNSPECNYGAF